MVQIWQSCQKWCFQLPCNAVRGGHESDGSPTYVGRVVHKGRLHPATVVPNKGCAFVANSGHEYAKDNYDILLGEDYSWKAGYQNGCVPANAVIGGTSCTGKPLYIGRAMHRNSLFIGKINRDDRCLYIPYGGKEHILKTYEVLVEDCCNRWVQVQTTSTCNVLPDGAVVAGHRACDHAPIYVARADHNGQVIPGKFVPSSGGCYICYDGSEHHKNKFEVLCGNGYQWISHHHHNCLPKNAVIAGTSCNGESLYIGRGHYEGSLTPGVVRLSQHYLLIPYFGKEIRICDYEILCKC